MGIEFVRQYVTEISYFVIKFLNQPFLSDVIQTSVIGLLTIIVAVAVFLVERSISEFDRLVILKCVVLPITLLRSLVLIFASLLFWDMASDFWMFVPLLASLFGLFCLVRILFRSYEWVRVFEPDEGVEYANYRMKLRLKYLKSIEKPEEKLDIWTYVWKVSSKSITEEIQYAKTFARWLEQLVVKGDRHSLYLTNRGVGEMEKSSKHISFSDPIIFQTLFQSILQINLQMFHHEDNTEKISLSNSAKRTISFFTQQALQKNNAYTFFQILAQHLESENSKQYSVNVIRQVARPFFQHVGDSNEKYDIWESFFPKEWKVSKETWEVRERDVDGQHGPLSWVWFNSFISWFRGRKIMSARMIKRSSLGIDEHLDEVVQNLFPTVCPITWGTILTFVDRSYTRFDLLINRQRSFGLFSRSYSSFSHSEEDSKAVRGEERDNAIELALIVFGRYFTRDLIRVYQADLKNVKCDEDSWQLSEKNELISMFNDMLEMLDNRRRS